MAGQRKKSKKTVSLHIEDELLRAIDLQAAREKLKRMTWIIQTAENRLRELGKWP